MKRRYWPELNQEIFSIAFRDRDHGVIVGGDYRQQDDTAGTAAITSDGGKTWTAVDKAAFRFAPVLLGQRIAGLPWALPGSDYSLDDGKTWKPIDKENYNSVGFTSTGEGWAVGPKGRIARFAKQEK